MFSVIFEVHPKKEQFDLYLALAKDLKPILQGIDGFVDNERFGVGQDGSCRIPHGETKSPL